MMFFFCAMENHFTFEDLKVYQCALNFVDKVYAVTEKYPSTEKFNLTSQFQRASVSISLNIAEGNGSTFKDNLKYLGIASRSLKECVVCTTISLRRTYLDKSTHDELRADLAEMSRMLSGLKNHMKKNLQ